MLALASPASLKGVLSPWEAAALLATGMRRVDGIEAAAAAIEAYQDASETLAVPDILAPAGDAYVLRVRGDSMIDEQIRDGDFVVVNDSPISSGPQKKSIVNAMIFCR